MNNLFFFPTFSDELKETSGCSISPYRFSFLLDGEYRDLKSKGKNTIKLEDALDSWKVEKDGLHLQREVVFEYPDILYGEYGIACKDAEIGVCIIWTNKTLTQMGTILPESVYYSGAVLHFIFEYDFGIGEISGDLELETMLYIKKAALNVLPTETCLMNETGVNVGTLDNIRLDFGSLYMDFPIQEVNSKQSPMWWLEINTWTDPRQDLFNEDNLCLFLNTAYDACPKIGDKIKNEDVLIDIITTAYAMIFQKISEMGFLSQTLNDVDLDPGSISKVVFYFWSSCEYPVDTSSFEKLHKTLWPNVAKMICEEDEE